MTSSTSLRRLSCVASALGALALALGASGAALAKGKSDPTVPGEVLMKLQSTSGLPALLTKYQLTLQSSFGARPIYRVKVAAGASAKNTAAALAQEPGVLLAEENVEHQAPEERKNNPWLFGTSEEYVAQWAPTAMRLPEAHAISTGVGTRVAVLDSGVELTHPALAGKLLPGFDFVDFDTDPSEGGTSASPGWGHGTHVAGLVALAAPGAKIMPVRVLDPDGFGNAWVLAEALLYAVNPDGNPATDDGAHVINMSLGTISPTKLFYSMSALISCTIVAAAPGEPMLDFSDPGYDGDKQRCANSKGAVIAAASGNDGTDRIREYPAAESAHGKLSIGASTSVRRLASFSNFGSKVDVAAPGEGITSTMAGGAYATWSGTSMATPLAAGTAALLRSRFPAWTPDDIVDRIDRTTSSLCRTDLRQIDAAAALTNNVPKDRRCR